MQSDADLHCFIYQNFAERRVVRGSKEVLMVVVVRSWDVMVSSPAACLLTVIGMVLFGSVLW